MTNAYIAAIPWQQDRADNARTVSGVTGAKIIWDRHHDHYETFLRMLRTAADIGGAAIFMEDDILLAQHWHPRIEAAIDAHPDNLIQFYSNRKADVEIGSRWEPGKTYLNNQCWYAPSGMPRELHDYLLNWPGRVKDPTGTDVAIGQYLHSVGQRYWLHVPSLVQHRGWTSAINPKRPRKGRQSRTFKP